MSDIRNSKVTDVVKELKSYSCNVEVIDPHANPEEVAEEYHFELSPAASGKYDAVIVAVNHAEYKDADEAFFDNLLTDRGLLVDIKGIYRGKMKNLNYWSL